MSAVIQNEINYMDNKYTVRAASQNNYKSLCFGSDKLCAGGG